MQNKNGYLIQKAISTTASRTSNKIWVKCKSNQRTLNKFKIYRWFCYNLNYINIYINEQNF